MNDITLNINKDYTLSKLRKVKFYRTCTYIKNNIQDYLEANYLHIFKYIHVKNDLSVILNKYNVKYEFEYIYDIYHDEIKINLDNNFIIDLNFNFGEYQY